MTHFGPRPAPFGVPPAQRPAVTPAVPASAESGEVTAWFDDKGYGWIGRPDGKIFFHIRDVRPAPRRPRIGDHVTYIRGADASGRACAKRVELGEAASSLGLVAAALLGILLLLPLVAIATLPLPLWTGPVVVVLLSLACYFAYGYDKEKAKAGTRRLRESHLHLFELLGGWPGAFVAQRRLRHKCAKRGYQFVFWSIVILHQLVALDLLLDWKMLKSLLAQLNLS